MLLVEDDSSILSLPGLDREEMVAELARHQGRTPVLYLSGGSPKDVPHLADVLLLKPFRLDDLRNRVREMFRRPTTRQDERE